jgi:hypothetical protein
MSDCSHTIEQQLLAMQFVAMKARAVIIIDAYLAKNLNPSTLDERTDGQQMSRRGGRCQKMGDIALHFTPLPA